MGTISGAPSKCPSPPLSFPNRGQPRAEKGEEEGPAGEGARRGEVQPERLLFSGHVQQPDDPQRPPPQLRPCGRRREEGKQARGGALERADGGGRWQRCSPALTSIGGAAAHWPRWRSGLASPRWSSAAAQGTRALGERCGDTGRRRGRLA